MNRNHKILNTQNVIDRIQSGDLPVVNSSYSTASVFNDGTEVPHQIMQSVAHQLNLGDAPARGARWSLPMPSDSINA